MSLHILLCDEVLLYFIFVSRNRAKVKFDLNSIWIALYKMFENWKKVFHPLLALGQIPAQATSPSHSTRPRQCGPVAQAAESVSSSTGSQERSKAEENLLPNEIGWNRSYLEQNPTWRKSPNHVGDL
jgi:hypothetical protein